MKKIILGILVAVFASPLYSADAYLCITEQSIAFLYNKSTKEWKGANFKHNKKYVIKKSNKKNVAWTVTPHGSNDYTLNCRYGFNKLGYIRCNDIYRFRFNNKTMRFSLIVDGMYVVDPQFIKDGRDGEFLPNMSIGKCSEL